MSARVIVSGTAVPAKVAAMLPLVAPFKAAGPFGAEYNIPVGTIDKQACMMIVGMGFGETFYVAANELRAAPTGEFAQGYFIGQVSTEVYRRSAWVIPASKAVMAFSVGIAIGFFGVAGTLANVAVILTKTSLFVAGHPNETQIVKECLPIVTESFSWFKSNCPVLYGKLGALVGHAVWEAIKGAPAGIGAEDVANLLGRILGGVVHTAEGGFAMLLKVLAKTCIPYAALHLPGAAGHGVQGNPKAFAESLVEEIKRQAVTVTPAEKEQIQLEIMKSGNAARANLDKLKQALDRMSPALDKLMADYKAS